MFGIPHLMAEAPAELASARELVRRMSFDLTGLPPTGDEVEAFANEAAVDREAVPDGMDHGIAGTDVVQDDPDAINANA